jgi:23S rRNA (uracil1939-C5)-methyltransferase
VPNGYGLGFANGLTIFVSLAAAGDRLRVRVNQQKGKTAFAEIVEILEPSPDRVTPPCIYFGRCGGCDFQQMGYEAQLRAKTAIVRDCLKRIGKLDLAGEIETIGSPRPFGYRSTRGGAGSAISAATRMTSSTSFTARSSPIDCKKL